MISSRYNIVKLFIAIACCFLLSGCIWFNVTTTIEIEGNPKVTIKSKSDSLVKIKIDGIEAEVDNRGRPSGWELVLPVVLANPPEIQIGGND